MAIALTERVWHRAAAPGQIDGALRDLWSEVGREAPVSRALVSTLVVFHAVKPDERVDFEAPFDAAPLDEVVRRHPARVIVLHHSGGSPARCSPEASAITIVTFGAGSVRYGTERVAIRSSCADASLPSIIRRLAIGGVPLSVWWTDDLSRVPPIVPVATLGRRFLYDSRQWRDVHAAVASLAALLRDPHAPHLADVNWRRSLALRRSLTHAFSPSLCAASQPGAAHVTIQHRPGDAAMAWLVAGWMSSRLGLSANGTWPVRVEEMRRGSDILTVSVGGAETHDLVATMNGHRVLVKYREGAAPFVLTVPRETDADACAGELQTLGGDACLHDAVTALASHFAERR